MRFRIAWKSNATGAKGHGEWLASDAGLKEIVKQANVDFPELFHWVEPEHVPVMVTGGGSGLDAAFQELAGDETARLKALRIEHDRLNGKLMGSLSPEEQERMVLLRRELRDTPYEFMPPIWTPAHEQAYSSIYAERVADEKPTAAVFRKLESDLHEDALDRAAEAMLPSGSVDAEVEALLAAEAEEEAGNA